MPEVQNYQFYPKYKYLIKQNYMCVLHSAPKHYSTSALFLVSH